MKALAIDSASGCMTVSAKNDDITTSLSLDIGPKQSQELLPAIDFVLKKVDLKPEELDYMVLCKGPGTFTGLRLAFAALKSIELAFNKPVYGVSTLECYASPFENFEGLVISTVDAKKDQFFAGIYENKKTILEPVWKSIMSNSEYSPEEKNVYLLMTEKFLNRLTLMNWYIIVKFYKTDGFNEMLSILRQQLASYMTKSKVAEYISVMVMELALNSENNNVKKAAKYLYQGIDNSDTLIFDPKIRSEIVKELQRKHELVFLSWTLGGGSMSIGKQGLLQITLYNKDDEFQEVKENIESKMSANLNKKSLIDFYRQMPDGQEGTDLGLYYLSYLEDACKKVNIKFESIVNQSSSSDLTVINLKFNF